MEGRVLIGDQDIKDLSLTSVRKTIGVVPQDSVLFHNSIYYNVAYGRLNASRDEVMDTIKLADLQTAIEHMPNKYETQVGERGLKLSGKPKYFGPVPWSSSYYKGNVIALKLL